MRIKLLVLTFITINVVSCASVVKEDTRFSVTHDPENLSSYEITLVTNNSRVTSSEKMTAWVETKGRLYAKNKGCTHIREISNDEGYSRNTQQEWLGGISRTKTIIFDCVDVNAVDSIVSGSDKIKVNSKNYEDIKVKLFRYRDIANTIVANNY